MNSLRLAMTYVYRAACTMALLFAALSSAAFGQGIPPSVFGSSGGVALVNDAIVLRDGSQIVAGVFAVDLEAGTCPGEGCLTATAAGSDGFVARLDSQGRATWLRTIGGANASASADNLLHVGDTIYVSGNMTGEINVGALTVGAPATRGVFVAALSEDGQTTRWVSGISGTSAAALHAPGGLTAVGDGPDFLVVGGSFDCDLRTLPARGVLLAAPCDGSTQPFLAAVEVPDPLLAVTDTRPFINEEWKWATNANIAKGNFQALAAVPSGVLYASMTEAEVFGQTEVLSPKIVRITNTFGDSPSVSYKQSGAGDTQDIVAVDDDSIVVAGPGISGALLARLIVTNPARFESDWFTQFDGSSRFSRITSTGASIIGVGTFNFSLTQAEYLDGVTSTTESLDGASLFAAGPAGFIARVNTLTGRLESTSDATPRPWVFGGDLGAYRLPFSSFPSTIHTDGLGRIILGGNWIGSSGTVFLGNGKATFDGVEGWTSLVSISGTEVTDEDWTVGQPIRNEFPIELGAEPPRAFRNGIAFDAYSEGLLYLQPPTSSTDGRIFPLSATDEPIEIRWTNPADPTGDKVSLSSIIEWPAAVCTPASGPTAACVQRHVAGAPVELNSAGYSFRQLFQPVEEGSADATADPATGVLVASEEGYSVVRYADVSQAVLFEVVRTEPAVNFVTRPRRVVPIGREIRAPADFAHQPDRPGYVLNPAAYVDGLGAAAAYDRSRRAGQIIPVNRVNPAAGEQALDVAWYRESAKGVFWPARVDEYAPEWPDEVRGLIISAIEFSGNSCSDPARIQIYNARRSSDTDPGFILGEDYVLEYSGGDWPLDTFASVLNPGESLVIDGAQLGINVCRDGFVRLLRQDTLAPVDQFGVPGTSQAWAGGPVDAADMVVRRNPNVCLGNADRVNPFAVGLEWQPATSVFDDHATQCVEAIIIASQAGSEVSGRDFPTELIISQVLDDGPADSEGSNQDQIVEIYNGTNTAVDLSDYALEIRGFDQGASLAPVEIPLSGQLLPDQTRVLAHTGNSLRDEGFVDAGYSDLVFDGNDALVLKKLGVIVDAFGASVNPGSRWLSQGVSTQGTNLVRSGQVCAGAAGPLAATFEPHLEWVSIGDPNNELAGAGLHATNCLRTQPALESNRFIDWSIYAQNDPEQIGFNPNDEHALRAASRTGTGFDAAFALRADFGAALNNGKRYASEPHVLVRYRQPADLQEEGAGAVGFRVFRVEAFSDESEYTSFEFDAVAGSSIDPPYPLSPTQNCAETVVEGRPFFRDYTNRLWARSASSPMETATIRYFYPMRQGFYFADARPNAGVGDCVPWMPDLPIGGVVDSLPIPTVFDISWPDRPLQLIVGETLIDSKRGLPQIRGQGAVEVVFDQVQEQALLDAASNGGAFDPRRSLVEYFDPLQSRSTPIDGGALAIINPWLPPAPDPASGLFQVQANALGYKLPFSLRSRLRVDKANNRLIFRGYYREAGNDPLLLLNVLNSCEINHLKAFGSIDPAVPFDCTVEQTAINAWTEAVDRLARSSRNPAGIEKICVEIAPVPGTEEFTCNDDRPVTDDEILIGYTDTNNDGILERFSQAGAPGALSAGAAQGSGFVTIVLNNDPQLSGTPVDLKVMQVGCLDIGGVKSPYQGRIHVIESDGIFDETLSLRHSSDFAGRLDQVTFQWCIAPDSNSEAPTPPGGDARLCNEESPWDAFPGAPADGPEISIQGVSADTLADNWLVARYQLNDADGGAVCRTGDDYSLFAGAPGGTPRNPQAQLAQGWIKRVVDRLNPFDTRVTDFNSGGINTVTSLIAQLGERFAGDIPLVTTPDVLNSLGFIEAYETVLNRALESVYQEAGKATDASNNAVLLISTRLADFYTALANEAYADAQDPLVGLTRPVLGTIATETFNFKNQLASLLEEELVLLRGRDNSQGSVTARPVYNRLFPNFTGAEGQAAYAIAYNITDQTGPDGTPDSNIDERDALALFPQGHGDAWGHFLQALSYHYNLLRNQNFSWKARTENVLLNGGPLPVDYLDERKFAANAAMKAKIGTQVLDLTYREFYTEDPDGQWQGYKDNDLGRQWGVSGWASRAGQGAYYDWLTANSIIPAEHKPLAFAPEVVDDFCSILPSDPFCACTSTSCQADSQDVSEFRGYFCGLPENDSNAYCDCVEDNGRLICPLKFEPQGIQVIERGNVPELDELLDQFQAVQTRIDEVNRGLNPLGISRDAVPFDIDPSRVDQNETHFEQVAERAATALENAAEAWDFANRISEMLRFNQNDVDDIRENNLEAEFDFVNRLLDIYGTPYPDRIGAGKTYPDGYDGPDILHYNETGVPALTGTEFALVDVGPDGSITDVDAVPGVTFERISAYYAGLADSFDTFTIDRTLADDCLVVGATSSDDPVTRASDCARIIADGGADLQPQQVEYYQLTSPSVGSVFINPGGGQRRITGRLQQAYADALNARIDLSKAIAEYDAHVFDIIALKDQFAETYDTRAEQIGVQSEARAETRALLALISLSDTASAAAKGIGSLYGQLGDAAQECLPTAIGLSTDALAPGRCAIKFTAATAQTGFEGIAASIDAVTNTLDRAKEDIALRSEIEIASLDAQLELIGISGDLSSAIEHEPALRLEVARRAQDVQAAQAAIGNLISDGQTVQVEFANYKRRTASSLTEYRFQDIAFRQFRNDAIQKYRATFDLAARFVYLAAKAYDYETNLLGSDSRAGQQFLTDIVRHRSIGQLLDGQPIAGSNGLADSLGRMQLNFQVLKGQMGFNNPQIETNRFSLRRELFRIPDRDDADYVPADEKRWARELSATRVLDLNSIPEFRRLARPFAAPGNCPQPGLVIEFFSEVKSGDNFFGLELEARDSAYDASQFATKIRGVGAWFKDYDGNTLGVSETPRVYLLPVGDDVLRAANGLNFDTRLWDVVDQVIPVPFPIGDNDLARPEWNPGSDSLSDAFSLERRIGRFRAFPFRELGFDQEFSTDSRLIGRSVWNNRWLLIIPGASLLGDADSGLDRFIYGEDVSGTYSESDAVRNRFDACSDLSVVNQAAPENFTGGVSDILLFFKTYAYSGN